MIKADLHVHTAFSGDSANTISGVIARCLDRGINCVAITDHNTIAGALKVQQQAPFTVIVGEEVRTTEGEVIGLFLKEEVPLGLTPQATVDRIKAQGGLVCIPHPFDRVRHSPLKNSALMAILPGVDIIEAFNARTLFRRDIDTSLDFARAHGLLYSAGSDAHTPGEIGNACVEMPDFNGPEEFRQALAQGRIAGRQAGLLVHLASRWNKIKRALG
ncbi:MAG: PHP domain-containing protein [Chloroflexi bacterium]|nr:PHP domain-containing protein [Chloroflexota bacterium]